MRDPAPIRCSVLLLAVVTLCAAGPASALPELFTQATGSGCATVVGTISATLGPCVDSGLTIQTRAAAGFGHLEAFNSVTGNSTGPPAGGAGGTANAWYRDTITFHNAALTGTPGTVTFIFGITGSMSTNIPSGDFSAAILLQLSQFDAPFQSQTVVQSFLAPPSSIGFDGPVASAPMNIVWGTPIDLQTQIQLLTGVPAGFLGPVAISLNFEGSLNLDSIEAMDQVGNPVAFTASGDSGTSYPAVPEPAEAILVLVGAAAVSRFGSAGTPAAGRRN